MNNKKFKILAIADVILIVGLVVLLVVLKGRFYDQAQTSVKEQTGAYKKVVNTALEEQWKALDQYGMAWKLIYATVTGVTTETAFNAEVTKIVEDKDARLRQLSYFAFFSAVTAVLSPRLTMASGSSTLCMSASRILSLAHL